MKFKVKIADNIYRGDIAGNKEGTRVRVEC